MPTVLVLALRANTPKPKLVQKNTQGENSPKPVFAADEQDRVERKRNRRKNKLLRKT